MNELQKQLSAARGREQAALAQLTAEKKARVEERKKYDEDRVAEETQRTTTMKDEESKRVSIALQLQSLQTELTAANARLETSSSHVASITDQSRKREEDLRTQLVDTEAREEGLKVALQLARDAATSAQSELRRYESGAVNTTRELEELKLREATWKKQQEEWRQRDALLTAQSKEALSRVTSLEASVAESIAELAASRQREDAERNRANTIENKLAEEVAARRRYESEHTDRETSLRKTIADDHAVQASATAKLVEATNELDNARADLLLARKHEAELASRLNDVELSVEDSRKRGMSIYASFDHPLSYLFSLLL
jgi:chromosome segregation ATPase